MRKDPRSLRILKCMVRLRAKLLTEAGPGEVSPCFKFHKRMTKLWEETLKVAKSSERYEICNHHWVTTSEIKVKDGRMTVFSFVCDQCGSAKTETVSR